MLRTPTQRTTLCKDCPVASVADLLGDSCTLLIVRDLLERPRRYGEIASSLSGISTRTLATKLKRLESDGIIEKKPLPESSYSEYRLTQKGADLGIIIDAMRTYGNRYLSARRTK